MKLRFLFLSLFFPISYVSMGQNLIPVADKKGKMGYKDSMGEIVIKYLYDYAEPFDKHGLAKVGKSGKFGLIDQTGKFVLPMQYADIDPRDTSDPVKIKKGKLYGLISPVAGSILVEPLYTNISNFNCYGLAWFTKGGKIITADGKQSVYGGKIGIVDKTGKILLNPVHKGVFEFSEHTKLGVQYVFGEADLLDNFAYMLSDTLKTDCKLLGYTENQQSTMNAGVMDINGKLIIEKGKYTWIAKPSSGMMRYWNVKGKNISYGYHDMSSGKTMEVGQVKSEMKEIKYVTHGDFYGVIAPVNSTAGWKFIDKNANEQKGGFKSVKFEKDNEDKGYWAGIADGNSVVYGSDGVELFPQLTFSDVNMPQAKYGTSKNFALKMGEKWALVDNKGTTLIAPQYEYLTSSRHGLYGARLDSKWGMLDETGKIKIPLEYQDIVVPEEENPRCIWVRMGADSLYYNYDIAKQSRCEDGYVYVTPFAGGLAWAKTQETASEEKEMRMKMEAKSQNTNNKTKKKTSTDNVKTEATKVVPNRGILYGEDNIIYVDFPYEKSINDKVKSFVAEQGNKPLTSSRSKSLVLKLSQKEKHHLIDKVIPEDEWDY